MNAITETMNCSRRVSIGCMMMALVAMTMMKCVVGFSPVVSIRSNTKSSSNLNYVPAREDDFVEGDVSAGGVGLARDSAIKIVGDIKHKPGKADSFPKDLLRYNNLLPVDEATVQSALKSAGSTILCTGQGVELYKAPGQTTNKEVYQGPKEAVKDAITTAASAMESETLVFNFLGGDDLMLGEVMDACGELVLALDIATKANISFNSVSHKSIPSGTCTVTATTVGGSAGDSLSGAEKAIAQGEVYSRDGTWYTLEESDLNTANE
uniref:Uncharacterized protein n=1 Tax=Pseudo-nitzschia australis TaxID=44445 RepID=A0A7S4EQX2_9STRA